jgi:hypothetical protein
MLTALRNLFSGRSGRPTSATTPKKATPRLEVETLDERALPSITLLGSAGGMYNPGVVSAVQQSVQSSVPNLAGVNLHLSSTWDGTSRDLFIQSETVTGYGTATFTGTFSDPIVFRQSVSGTIAATNPDSYGSMGFHVAYSGWSSQSYTLGGEYGSSSAGVWGSGDFHTDTVSSNAAVYQLAGGAQWYYQGTSTSWYYASQTLYGNDYYRTSDNVDYADSDYGIPQELWRLPNW